MIPLCEPAIAGNEIKYISECIEKRWISTYGEFIKRFEDKFKEFLGVKHAIAVSSGTAALHLALRALNIGEEDEVIIPSLTFIATANAVKYVGAEPVFVDVRKDTFVLDVEKVEEMITPKTKAIIPVHLYGYAADMEKLRKIAEKYDLYIIEDATEALGTKFKGRYVGTFGEFGCFSFNGNKLITTGNGGMIVTNRDDLAEYVRYLSSQAKTMLSNNGFVHNEIGYNYRLPNLLAAFGLAQLEKLEEFLRAKRRNAEIYNLYLKDVQGIITPCDTEEVENSYWLYSIVVTENFCITRDELIDELKKHEIESRPFFQPIHLMRNFRNCKKSEMDNTEYLASHGVNLPSSVNLEEKEIELICSIIKRYA